MIVERGEMMRNLKKIKWILLIVVCMVLLSNTAFASTGNNLNTSCDDKVIESRTVLVNANDGKIIEDDIDLSNVKNSRGEIMCCEPSSPKTRVLAYQHSYYSLVRCDWKVTTYDKCNYCGTLWYVTSTAPKSHSPGIGYYCPY